MKTERTPAQLASLERARQKRAVAQDRRVPEGYRSIEHFLDSVRERAGRRLGGVADLATYLRVSDKSVRRWINREKIPMQETINALEQWMLRRENR